MVTVQRQFVLIFIAFYVWTLGGVGADSPPAACKSAGVLCHCCGNGKEACACGRTHNHAATVSFCTCHDKDDQKISAEPVLSEPAASLGGSAGLFHTRVFLSGSEARGYRSPPDRPPPDDNRHNTLRNP